LKGHTIAIFPILENTSENKEEEEEDERINKKE